MELKIKEPKNLEELKEWIKDKQDIPEIFYVAVESSIFDKDNKWILMRRGHGCKDGRLKLEGIGGEIESSDKTFIEGLKREISEEAGDEAQINIRKFLYARTEKVFDLHANIDKVWIILSYVAVLESGELVIMEKDKNLGYERYEIDKININELTECAKSTYEKIKLNWEEIKTIINDR